MMMFALALVGLIGVLGGSPARADTVDCGFNNLTAEACSDNLVVGVQFPDSQSSYTIWGPVVCKNHIATWTAAKNSVWNFLESNEDLTYQHFDNFNDHLLFGLVDVEDETRWTELFRYLTTHGNVSGVHTEQYDVKASATALEEDAVSQDTTWDEDGNLMFSVAAFTERNTIKTFYLRPYAVNPFFVATLGTDYGQIIVAEESWDGINWTLIPGLVSDAAARAYSDVPTGRDVFRGLIIAARPVVVTNTGNNTFVRIVVAIRVFGDDYPFPAPQNFLVSQGPSAVSLHIAPRLEQSSIAATRACLFTEGCSLLDNCMTFVDVLRSIDGSTDSFCVHAETRDHELCYDVFSPNDNGTYAANFVNNDTTILFVMDDNSTLVRVDFYHVNATLIVDDEPAESVLEPTPPTTTGEDTFTDTPLAIATPDPNATEDPPLTASQTTTSPTTPASTESSTVATPGSADPTSGSGDTVTQTTQTNTPTAATTTATSGSPRATQSAASSAGATGAQDNATTSPVTTPTPTTSTASTAASATSTTTVAPTTTTTAAPTNTTTAAPTNTTTVAPTNTTTAAAPGP